MVAIKGVDILQFRLLYSGELLGASKTNTRADLKHAVRRQLHPQLRRLWKANSAVRQSLATQVELSEGLRAASGVLSRSATMKKSMDELIETGINRIAAKWERFGYRFVPLITEELSVRCSVDLLFLRPETPGMLMKGGDLDARLKTLFDALRLPSDQSESGGIGPQEDENPFFCLLEDDKLISEVHLTTDELLVLPKDREVKPNDAFLVIHVKTKPIDSVNHWKWSSDF